MRIIDQHHAYHDNDGETDLESYSPDKCAHVTTSDPEYSIGVLKLGIKDFRVYLIHKDEPICVVYLEHSLANLYQPSIYMLRTYRGRGLGKMLYKWFLDSGMSLVTGDAQSPLSHRLWKSLSKEYGFAVVQFHDDMIIYHGENARKHMCINAASNVLLHKDLTVEKFAESMYLEVRKPRQALPR